jgi:ABC-type spermidine/putrescine transport system permease subunit II
MADSGCINNGVNSTRVECFNTTHLRTVSWSGTSCSGANPSIEWVRTGCSDSNFVTCVTVSGATGAGVTVAALAVAAVAAFLSSRKHE